MASARDEIMARVAAQRRDATPPPVWRSRRHFEDLRDRFEESLRKVKGETIRAGSLDEALAALDSTLADLGAQSVVVNGDSLLAGMDWAGRWPERTLHVAGQSDGDLRAFCASADVGVSSADAALAETGSIIVTSGPGRSRLATLLPPVHVALVPASRLTTDLFTFTAARSGAQPAMMTIISGPSKTADIEQTMAIGMHGPKRFIVILFDD
ncbi:MAG TPA: lactate utilization protein [Aggregatilinea sp.]|jgi:L-lactate utilization protein LutC|uniref:LutC/YkgG family protein n=1 Tax=Aggregatilinea sp. TaxID=2806333 RepID=UPI002C8F1844|nr:lactate utilization protein [Aggregatilinea sp.]HML24909.1 lactate utilization protein [Aggregatilinea sp.]